MNTINNIEIKSDRTAKAIGYKSFNGMVYLLKRINKRYKKLGVSGQFTITLPLKD